MDARTAVGWALVVLLTLVVWLLVEPFLGWLLASGLLAFALYPVHLRLADRIGAGPSAGVLTVIVVLLILVPVAYGLQVLVTRGVDLVTDVSRAEAVAELEAAIRELTGYSVPVADYANRIPGLLESVARDRAAGLLGRGLHALLGFLLLPFLLYYLLKDGDRLVDWVRTVTPLDADVREQLFDAIEDMIWAVLTGHVLVAIVQGAVAGVSLFVTGVPSPLVLTLVMMVLAIVPIVGVAPVLGGAIGYLLLAGQPLSALVVFVWGMTAVAVTDDYLRAALIDRGSEMHSAFVLVGVLGGSYLFGAIGLFVGPVVVGLWKTTIEVLGDAYGVIGRE
jgi:predicted PurR-regulated permease PerM